MAHKATNIYYLALYREKQTNKKGQHLIENKILLGKKRKHQKQLLDPMIGLLVLYKIKKGGISTILVI